MYKQSRTKLAKNAKEFTKQLNDLANLFQDDVEDIVNWSVLELFSEIILESPVDKGAYKASHSITNAGGSTSYISGPVGESDSGNSQLAETKARQQIQGWRWTINSGKIIMFNNQPYAETLEFGGYPNPPLKGSWNKHNKSFEIKSEGGFSKQAPKGIYSLAILRWPQIVQAQIGKLK